LIIAGSKGGGYLTVMGGFGAFFLVNGRGFSYGNGGGVGSP